ncbi:hypothetical protein ZIOFF_053004 [Zingiber officinale]|uniref:Uncharacterized protein n=1 Tax=Zingiber officinale TaxID=94328 RepID=A0A8J5FBV0_ZINOF|nr:hypothetical protein ZIOFF_053004 [Zingiber officinale]
MIRDRGFPVPDDELALTLPAFRSKFGDQPKLDDLRISLSIPCKGSPPKKITELLVNITKHVLMPKHELLTTDEKQDLLKKYNVGESQFPRMLESDPVSRYHGLKKGQIVKVTYEGELTGSHVTYRCVL